MTIIGEHSVRTTVPGERTAGLAARRVQAVSKAVSVGQELYIERGEGALLYDVDGNQLLDFGAGIAVASIGHAHPAVVAAVSEQAARFEHTCFMVTPYASYVEVCEALNRLTPGDHPKKSALFNSGAEAVENAIKIARAATGRQAVVAFEHAYHGRTNLTMALTSKVQPYKQSFGPFAPEIYRMPMAYPYRWPTGAENCAEEAFAQFVSRVHIEVGESNVAAVLLEPIQGEGGFIEPAPGFVAKLSQWCADNGVVFIADEVQSGFCRTGDWFAISHEGVVPDLITTAKALGGGMPLAAVTGRAELMDAPVPGGLGGTYGGNPVSCAAALATIAVMEAEDFAGRAAQLGATIRRRLLDIAESHPQVGEVRGRGAMQAIELVDPETGAPNAPLTAAVLAAARAKGLVALGCGSYGNVIRLLPPLVITDAQLAEGLDILASAMAEATA